MANIEQMFLLDCKREENFDYDDKINLCKELIRYFNEDDNLDAVEIYALDDDYLDYIKKKGIKDNIVARKEYVTFNKHKDYIDLFARSRFSEIIDAAVIPVAIFNEKKENKTFDFRITDDKRRSISDYLSILLNNNSAANPVFGGTNIKKIYINDYILRPDEKIFEDESLFIDEILYANNYGITKKYKTLSFYKEIVFTMGFIYVISINKIPRIVDRQTAKSFFSSVDGIVNTKISGEEIQNILQKNEELQIFPITNYLIYPDELEEAIEDWLEEMQAQIKKQKNNLDKMNDILENKTKKGKKI